MVISYGPTMMATKSELMNFRQMAFQPFNIPKHVGYEDPTLIKLGVNGR
jgi:hypothetical protein